MLRTGLNVDIRVRYVGRFYECLLCMLGSFRMSLSLIFLRVAFKACIISILQMRELRLRGYIS